MPDIERAMPQDNAGMVKLVYTTDSKSVAFGRGGSSPPTGTIFNMTKPRLTSGLCCIWSLGNVAFAVAAGMPVQSVRLTGTIYRQVAFIAAFRRFECL